MNPGLLGILEQICAIEGLDCTFGVFWRKSGSVLSFETGGSMRGYNIVCATGHKHYYAIAKEPLVAAKEVLVKLELNKMVFGSWDEYYAEYKRRIAE